MNIPVVVEPTDAPQSKGEPTSSQRLLERAKGSHASMYFTLISIVQGVAFSFLSFLVVNNHGGFSFVGWLLASTTLLAVAATWNEYVMGVICFRWVPDLLDAVIPFMLGAAEVFVIQSVSNKPDSWFLAMAILSFIGFLAFANMYLKAKREGLENRHTFAALGLFVPLSLLYPLFSALLLLSFWLAVKFLIPTPILGAILSMVSAAIMFGFLLRTVLYWNRFVSYARDYSAQPRRAATTPSVGPSAARAT